MKLLFVDTESDPETKEPEFIQLKMNGKPPEIIDPSNTGRLYELWSECDAVIMHNAPYDMGVLSSLPGNSFKWKNNAWEMKIGKFKYTVMKINFHYNRIKPESKGAPPVIDTLKLWSILIEEKDISLKSLIRRELKKEPILYSKENAKTRAYQEQDVVCLEEIWNIFLDKVKDIPVVSKYSATDWGKICTPATFAKSAYEAEYPNLGLWQKENIKQDKDRDLENALEEAYNGGITCALLHGTRDNTAWYDIHGAYAHVIEYENMDRYKHYAWEEAGYSSVEPRFCFCETDVVLRKVKESLKIFRLEQPTKRWMWNFDIEALKCLFPDANIKIEKVLYPRPLLKIEKSLSAEWSALKEEEERLHGKTTLRGYYKLLSNTSYGITAQRDPWPTRHTNMVAAGIITSRAHLILCQMIETARLYGCDWLYSDTDSICVDLHGCDPGVLEKVLNDRIAPYSCGCEFIGKTKVVSLKRYLATNGWDLEGKRVDDKVRTHGKSVYDIGELDMRSMLLGKPNYAPLRIKQVGANTERTFKRCEALNEKITHPHPFMFETDIETELRIQDFFDKWREHIDTKTTVPENATFNDDFLREFHVFKSESEAEVYFGEKPTYEVENLDTMLRQWDEEDKLTFGELL